MAEYVQLCHKVKTITPVVGMFMSEKLDGQRCWWDGGITRGLLKNAVPWANCLKDGRYVSEQRSTGLWSRLGNVIHAPDWWVDQLPNVMLDGELWAGYEHRQSLMTAIKGNSPSFKGVYYHVYDAPPVDTMLAARIVNVGGGRKLTIPPSHAWYQANAVSNLDVIIGGGMPFRERYSAYTAICNNSTVLKPVQQTIVTSRRSLDDRLEAVLNAGGEGLVLKTPNGLYATERSHQCLKFKPFDDAEGVITGWTAGAETDKGSRLLGKMGSLRIKYAKSSIEFDLSGFTDEERELIDPSWAIMNPGKLANPHGSGPRHFNHGQVVTFKYRGLTADGKPMEARYWRNREDE